MRCRCIVRKHGQTHIRGGLELLHATKSFREKRVNASICSYGSDRNVDVQAFTFPKMSGHRKKEA